jgi:hypothetical protein
MERLNLAVLLTPQERMAMRRVVTRLKTTIRPKVSGLRVDWASWVKMRQGLNRYKMTRERERRSMEPRCPRRKPKPTMTKIGRTMVRSIWIVA